MRGWPTAFLGLVAHGKARESDLTSVFWIGLAGRSELSWEYIDT